MSGIHFKFLPFVMAALLIIGGCTNDDASTTSARPNQPLFKGVNAKTSGLTFANVLTEDSVINYFTYPYIYMGGGIAIGDLNNDGLDDIYCTGNMVDNALFLNQGNLQFTDVTDVAGVASDDRWVTGATMADVNADGWLDIYVSVSGKFTTTKNQLYLNRGTNQDGIPTFDEVAESSGIADEGHTTQAAFFDYDKDGDLDVYLANYPYTDFKTRNYTYAYLHNKKEHKHSDHLYANDGDGTFTDVSEKAGILNFGLGLSTAIGDFNNDGWEDIYVSNDFASPDFFYLNNGDGTFTDRIKESTNHTAFFGMGSDAADFNNDGLLDLIQLDMTPEDNRRNKANMASMDIAGFWEIVSLGMHYQYMQNVLQLNAGITADGVPHFSDIARISGISSTDWSWASLLTDLDNDGWKDILITNGTRRDINNKDYFNSIEKANYQEKIKFDQLELSLNIPSEKVDNYVFRNNENLEFENVSKQWGLDFSGYSNGASYADLDNDGDLDIVVNNIDEEISLFENRSNLNPNNNYLKIKLKGSDQNPFGIGAKVTVVADGVHQMQHVQTTRGFQSSVPPILFFGLDASTQVDQLTIDWTDGKRQLLENVQINQTITLDKSEAEDAVEQSGQISPLMVNVTSELDIDFTHVENPHDDYQFELLLPHMYSRNGPALCVGDVNNDGLDDFFVGGAIGQTGSLFLQTADGTFTPSNSTPWEKDALAEDMDAVFFDADNDGDLDLYVVSGGNEHMEGNLALNDRLYLNKGDATFSKENSALPNLGISGACVRVFDYDQDGDQDLFVGGRIVPQRYPVPASSFILKNNWIESDKLEFKNVSNEIAPALDSIGLVTDARWADYNNDGHTDLIIVGEWTPILVLKNSGSQFEKQNIGSFEHSEGWWYSIVSDDFDNDGDIDFVAGNLGLNYKYQASPDESFDVYYHDFDKNGQGDIVLGYYNDGVQYPLRGRQCSSEQIPAIKYKYKDYNTFAEADLVDVYTQADLDNALHFYASTFESWYIENLGDGTFNTVALPREAQFSNINEMLVLDLNNDGLKDIVAAGNIYTSEVETTRNDASYGQVLLQHKPGVFEATTLKESGFFVKGDVKQLDILNTTTGKLILAARNNDSLVAFKINAESSVGMLY